MIQTFFFAKKLMREIAKEYNIKSEEDFIKFTNSKNFDEFIGVIPKKPWHYYSKKNVERRMKK